MSIGGGIPKISVGRVMADTPEAISRGAAPVKSAVGGFFKREGQGLHDLFVKFPKAAAEKGLFGIVGSAIAAPFVGALHLGIAVAKAPFVMLGKLATVIGKASLNGFKKHPVLGTAGIAVAAVGAYGATYATRNAAKHTQENAMMRVAQADATAQGMPEGQLAVVQQAQAQLPAPGMIYKNTTNEADFAAMQAAHDQKSGGLADAVRASQQQPTTLNV